MTWTNYGAECRNEGIEQGIEQGAEQERIVVVSTMLKKGKTPEEISDLLGYEMNFVLSCQANKK